MTLEKWIIHPGETRVIDIETVRIAQSRPHRRTDRRHRPRRARRPHRGARRHHQGPPHRGHRRCRRDRPPAAALGQLPRSVPQLRRERPEGRDQRRGPPLGRADLGVVSASALVSGIRNDARLNTVSGDIIVDGLTGDLTVNAVSGDVQIRELVGALERQQRLGRRRGHRQRSARRRSTPSRARCSSTRPATHQVGLNTVSGSATVRLDEGYPANYVVRSVSGRVQVDGVVRSGKGTGPTTNFTGSVGELSGAFVDIRANSVSGDITVLRRAGASADAAAERRRPPAAGSRGGVVMAPSSRTATCASTC